MNSNWSNPTGGNWLLDGAATVAGQYPGMAGSENDIAAFNSVGTGSATLDVALDNHLRSLLFTNWIDTLTMNHSLRLTSTLGTFVLEDGSTISMADNTMLSLVDLGAQGTVRSSWIAGTITGGANTRINVTGSELDIANARPGGGTVRLGTMLAVQKSSESGNNGFVILVEMASNLILSGTDNFIDVGNGGFLELNHNISAVGLENLEGGIDFDVGHTGTLAVQVQSGGELRRWAPPGTVVPDQVRIQGAVYNLGGTVEVGYQNMLNITGIDADGRSYWQHTSANAKLKVQESANISAAGTYQIDTGAVELTAQSGGLAEALNGAGLIFGNANPTALTILRSTPEVPGAVRVQGSVTLGQNTTTTMGFSGTHNIADRLEVENGTLTLDGTLSLLGDQLPTEWLNFFAFAFILGDFTSITDNVGGTNHSTQVVEGPGVYYYAVEIT